MAEAHDSGTTVPMRTASTSHPSPPPSITSSPRRRGIIIASVAILVALVASVVVYRNSHSKAQAPAQTTAARDVPYLDGSLIRFSPSFAQRAGIKVERAQAAPMRPFLSVTGTVDLNPRRVAAIGARISGRVRTVHRVEGDVVKKGDPLAEIESAELGRTQAAAHVARAHAEAAIAQEKREHQLAEARVSSQREAELAAANAKSARAELFAAEQAVHALGGSITGQAGVLTLQSPIDGKIVDSHLSRGQFVEPSYTAFQVADLRNLWIELDVFEMDVASISAGASVEITPQTNVALTLHGTVAYVGDVIEHDSRSARVRVEVDNSSGALRVGQSVLARIQLKSGVEGVLTLPRAAVTHVDGKPTIFVMLDATTVEPRTIVVGSNDANRIEIKSGLQPGDQVVVEGVFALKSEIFR